MALHGGYMLRTGRCNGVSYLHTKSAVKIRWTMNVSLRISRYMSWQALWRRGGEKNTRFTTPITRTYRIARIWRFPYTTRRFESFSKSGHETRSLSTDQLPDWTLTWTVLRNLARPTTFSLSPSPWHLNFKFRTSICNILLPVFLQFLSMICVTYPS